MLSNQHNKLFPLSPQHGINVGVKPWLNAGRVRLIIFSLGSSREIKARDVGRLSAACWERGRSGTRCKGQKQASR